MKIFDIYLYIFIMSDNNLSTVFICLTCDSNLNNLTCINIFCTSFSRNDELLANFVLGVLRPSALEMNSNYICTQCYNLFEMLEEARWTSTNIENQILKIYKSSRDKRKLIKNNIIVNTDTNVNTDTSTNVNINNENELFMKNMNLRDKFDSETNLMQLDDIQALESLNHECNILTKNHHVIIDDLTKLQVIETPLIDLNLNNRDSILTNNKTENISLSTVDSLNQMTNDVGEKSKSTLTPLTVYNCSIAMKNIEHSEINKTIEFTNKQDCLDDRNNDKTLKEILDNDVSKTFINFNNTENENNSNDIKKKCNGNDKNNRKKNTKSSKDGKPCETDAKLSNYSCSQCKKKWKTLSELKIHMKSHSTVRPYMCEKCGQAYKHKQALEIHIGMHNGINPFQCDICNKCFTQKGALMRHLPIHTGEMPFQCEICGKRFVHHTSYNMHILSHTGKKTHQCPNCNLLLLSTSHLKRHMRIHTGEKPYSCPSCGRRFAQRYNLCAHQKIHATPKIDETLSKLLNYKCKHCSALFDVEEMLQQHIRENHDTQMQMKNNSEWITDQNESTNISQNVDDNWDNFSYPISIQ